MASPDYRSNQTAQSKTVSPPSGLADGDILLLFVYIENAAAVVFTPPAGFASVPNTKTTIGAIASEVFWKRASGESGNYTWSCSPAGASPLSNIAAYSGCRASGNPYDDSDNNAGVDNSCVLPSIDCAYADNLIVGHVFQYNFGATASSASFTNERFDTDGAALYDSDQAGSGASGTKTITLSGAGDHIGAILNLASTSGGETKSLTDTGSGTDNISSLLASLSRADSGVGTDQNPTLSASLSRSDAGVGVDNPQLAASLNIVEGALGGDFIDLSALLSTIETAFGVDIVSQLSSNLSLFDSGTSIDSLTLSATLVLSDTGLGTDEINIITEIIKTIQDIASGLDNVTVQVQLSITEDASGQEVLIIQAEFSLIDTGTGSDEVIVSVSIIGSTVWGHETGVLEDNIRTFATNWTGTGQAEGSGDDEKLRLCSGEFMISEMVETGVIEVTLLQNNYASGDTVLLQYRHGATEADCLSASWNNYTVPFTSLGYVQVRVESTA